MVRCPANSSPGRPPKFQRNRPWPVARITLLVRLPRWSPQALLPRIFTTCWTPKIKKSDAKSSKPDAPPKVYIFYFCYQQKYSEKYFGVYSRKYLQVSSKILLLPTAKPSIKPYIVPYIFYMKILTSNTSNQKKSVSNSIKIYWV